MVARVFAIASMRCEAFVELAAEAVGEVPGAGADTVDVVADQAVTSYDPERARTATLVDATREAGYSSSPE